MTTGERRPPLLLVGGGGGLVGRAVLPLLRSEFAIRSLHRSPIASEAGTDVEWVPGDVSRLEDFRPLLTPETTVINLAWYRWASRGVFRRLYAGLRRLLDAATEVGVRRFLQVSVPPAPNPLETQLPYLTYKRAFDHALAGSGLSYRIVRPTLLYGERDRLLGVMMRLIHRYRRFPMFGDGEFGVSPVATSDLARLLRQEAGGTAVGTVDVGGPRTYAYRELTDLMFETLGLRPRYFRLGHGGALALVHAMRLVGSTLLYPYEVDWLMSGMLALPAYTGLGPMERVEPYLKNVAAWLTSPRGLPGGRG